MPRIMNAVILMDQPNPTFRINGGIMSGNTTLPREEPDETIPSAKERRRVNQLDDISHRSSVLAQLGITYVETQDMLQYKMMDAPIVETIPWAKMKCQYFVNMDVINRPKTWRKVPTRSSTRVP